MFFWETIEKKHGQSWRRTSKSVGQAEDVFPKLCSRFGNTFSALSRSFRSSKQNQSGQSEGTDRIVKVSALKNRKIVLDFSRHVWQGFSLRDEKLSSINYRNISITELIRFLASFFLMSRNNKESSKSAKLAEIVLVLCAFVIFGVLFRSNDVATKKKKMKKKRKAKELAADSRATVFAIYVSIGNKRRFQTTVRPSTENINCVEKTTPLWSLIEESTIDVWIR